MLSLAAVGLVWLYCVIGRRWRRGFYWLLMYLPFAGVVTLALFTWPVYLSLAGGVTLPLWQASLLFKDLLFLMPSYIAFFARLSLGRESLRGLPSLPVGLMIALSMLVLGHMANPGVQSLLMGLIGLKVWLFYLPLFFLSFAYVASERDLFSLLRLLVGLSLIPSTIGIAEALLVQVIGHQVAMEAIYGEMAGPVTQRFTSFEVGGGMIARISSTFTFVAQYFNYTLAMLAPCYILWRGDSSRRWRRLGGLALLLVALASFLSGARAAFVYTPLLLVLIFGLERGVSGLMQSGAYVAGVLFAALTILGVGSSALYEHVSELVVGYSEDTAYALLVQAINSAPLGAGTGTNTGAARYAFAEPDAFMALENYYAKAAYELGLPGLFVVLGLFLSLILLGYRSYRRAQSPSLRSCATGLLAYLVVMIGTSLKGWMIDLDPVNVYFWVFAGVLMKLPFLESLANPLGQPSRNPGNGFKTRRQGEPIGPVGVNSVWREISRPG